MTRIPVARLDLEKTLDQTTPAKDPGTLYGLLGGLANRIRALSGKTNWYDAPDITLAQTRAHVDTGASAHGGIVATTDERLSDARTPTAHKASHAVGGIDPLSPADVGAIPASEKGAANGVGSLDANAKQPLSEVNAALLGGARRQGTWDASLGTPPATPADNDADRGKYWEVSVAGTTLLGGKDDWNPGDWIIWEGLDWGWVDNTDRVGSVDGQTGAVKLDAVYAPLSHVGSGGEAHAAVVPSGTAGFMSGPDKAKLDGIPAGGSAGYTAQTHIEGLNLVWVSGNGLTVTTGSAYVPGLSRVVEVTADIAKSGVGFTANEWRAVYLTLDANGVPDVLVSTTAPAAPYRGTARTMTGNANARFLGWVRSNGAGTMWNFYRQGDLVRYREDATVAPFRVLSGGVATTVTAVSLAALVPPTSQIGVVKLLNTGTDRSPNFGAVDGTGGIVPKLFALNPGNETTDAFPLSAAQGLFYGYAVAPASGGAFVDVLGYREER